MSAPRSPRGALVTNVVRLKEEALNVEVLLPASLGRRVWKKRALVLTKECFLIVKHDELGGIGGGGGGGSGGGALEIERALSLLCAHTKLTQSLVEKEKKKHVLAFASASASSPSKSADIAALLASPSSFTAAPSTTLAADDQVHTYVAFASAALGDDWLRATKNLIKVHRMQQGLRTDDAHVALGKQSKDADRRKATAATAASSSSSSSSADGAADDERMSGFLARRREKKRKKQAERLAAANADLDNLLGELGASGNADGGGARRNPRDERALDTLDDAIDFLDEERTNASSSSSSSSSSMMAQIDATRAYIAETRARVEHADGGAFAALRDEHAARVARLTAMLDDKQLLRNLLYLLRAAELDGLEHYATRGAGGLAEERATASGGSRAVELMIDEAAAADARAQRLAELDAVRSAKRESDAATSDALVQQMLDELEV